MTDMPRPWPIENTALWPVDKLLPYARNPKTHPPHQIDLIAKSLTTFGQTQAVLIDGDEGPTQGEVICGHGRILAAERLGWTQLRVAVAHGWSEEEKRAYRIMDNELGSERLAPYDEEMLRSELIDLNAAGFDLPLLGFSDVQLAGYLDSNPGHVDPDEVPESPAEPITKLGDVWQLGRHRLCCGDATKAEDVAKALAGVQPHLMVTDPPYGVEFDPTWRKGSEKRTYMGGDPDLEHVWKEAWALFPGDVIYIWYGHSKTVDLWIALEELGFEIRQPLIWNKMRFIIGRGDYSFNHEACFYGVRKKGKSHWQGARDQPTVWDIPHRASDTNHGAQKPVECMKRPIENSSSPGQAVYEPFNGSGTTIIAAEMTGRACHALEINPAYCDVTVERWETFTGGKATRELAPIRPARKRRGVSAAGVAPPLADA